MCEDLTKKQKEICRYILSQKGIVNCNNIAKNFVLAQTTIKAHLSMIYTKLGVNSKSELVYKLLTNQELLK